MQVRTRNPTQVCVGGCVGGRAVQRVSQRLELGPDILQAAEIDESDGPVLGGNADGIDHGHADRQGRLRRLRVDERARRRFATYFRMGASPAGALSLARLNTDIDVRHVLPSIRVPALVMHREGDQDARADEARYVAGKIPGARLTIFRGSDHVPFAGETAPVLDEIRAFVTGVRERGDDERILATVLFTDVVDSTVTLPPSEATRDRRLSGPAPISASAASSYRPRNGNPRPSSEMTTRRQRSSPCTSTDTREGCACFTALTMAS